MITSASNSQAVQTLMHFYIGVATAKTDTEMKVAIGFPLATMSSAATRKSGNDGQ